MWNITIVSISVLNLKTIEKQTVSLWFASLDVAQYLRSAKTSQDCNVLFPSVFPFPSDR